MYQEIVIFIFKILNFIVLVGLGGYFFKNRILPKIIIDIARKKSLIQGLFDRQQELEQLHYELGQTIEQEKKHCIALKQRIDLWQYHVEKASKKRKKEQEKNRENTYDHLQRRMKIIVDDKVKKEVFQKAIAGTRLELQEQFSAKQNADQFLSQVISWMAKN